ncbi:repeat-containing 97-like isoform X3 [Octopus vulgaris]|uniref:Repeat-containing 97-like isoform X3 n=1 Tax=Octopus vulgaris TaxID=6645 RepID=A0AA36F1S3_OCTVU|nr:repeat-containing 97-like isoform X3 [Octopus vulgaris]
MTTQHGGHSLYMTTGGGKVAFFSDVGNKTGEFPFLFDNIKPLFDAQKFIAWRDGSKRVHSWGFQKGRRHLVRKKVCTQNELSQDVPSEIILDNNDIKDQKCFISVNANIVVFFVQFMNFLYSKQRLHQTRICAMTYFKTYQLLITGSEDGCIKVWDPDWNVLLVFVGHNDKIIKLIQFPHSIANLVSVSTDETLRIWNLETQEEIRSFKIISIKMTNHPAYPQRAIVICDDFSIRIINPHTGQNITKLLLISDCSVDIVDCVYAISEDTLFVLLKDGSLLKASTLRNPCQIMSIWTYNSPSVHFSSLVLYEHVINLTQNVNMPSALKLLTTQTIKSGVMAAPPNTNRTILVAGRFNGEICILDWFEGTINFQIQAHGNKEVLSLVSNPRFDQLISSGRDLVIKIWRFYAFAADCLIPLMSFYCSQTPTHMTVLQNFLVVAFKDYAMLNFSLVSYDLRNYMQYDQNPSCEHFDQIISLTSCPKLGILASASIDQTIKIWNETNNLIQTLQLEAIPESLCFYGEKGDLLVGLSRHIYKIPNTVYLPNSYKVKLMSMTIKKPIPDTVTPVDESTLSKSEYLHQYQALRMEKSMLPFYVDHSSPDTTECLISEDKAAHQMFKERNNDLETLQSGSTQQKKKNLKNVKRTAFFNYMRVINKVIAEQSTPEDTLASIIDGNEVSHRFKSISEFQRCMESPENPNVKKQPDRYGRIQKPRRREFLSEKKPHEPLKKALFSLFESGEQKMFSLSKKVTHLLNEYKKISKIIMSHNETVSRTPVSVISTPSRVPQYRDDSSYDIPPSKIPSTVSTAQASELMCTLSKSIVQRTTRSASAEPSQTSTVFQEYVKKILSADWFQKRFGDLTDILTNMVHSNDFILSIIPLLNSNSMEIKFNILNTIIDTFSKFGADDREAIAEAIVNLLKEDPFDLDSGDEDRKKLIQLAMSSLEIFHVENDDMVMQHLKHYIYGDETIRNCAITSLKNFGLGEGVHYLQKELDEFHLQYMETTPWIDTEVQLEKWVTKWKKFFQRDIRVSFHSSTKPEDLQDTLPSVYKFRERCAHSELSEDQMELSDTEITNVDILNYFCEIQSLKEIPPKEEPQKEKSPKPSIIENQTLPKEKITHLTRLGETYTSVCKPKRETLFYTNYKKPPITYKDYLPHQLKHRGTKSGFYLSLPKLQLNPFANEDSPKKKTGNDLPFISLEKTPKYFVPSLSLASPSR